MCRCGNGNGPASVGLEDATVEREAVEKAAEALIAYAECGSDLGSREGPVFEGVEEVGFEVTSGVAGAGGVVDDLEVGVVGVVVGVVGGVQPQRYGCGAGSCAVLGSEGEGVAAAVEEEAGVVPCVEVTGPAQVLAGGTRADVLACVVDDGDGDVERALDLAQVSEYSGDITGEVLIDAMKSDEGIEEEEPRAKLGDGAHQAALIAVEVEA